MTQHVIVTEHNPEWKLEYEREAFLIREILGGNCEDIHHIGSTSVEGLKAKPIIDIMPEVKNLAAVDEKAERFEAIGYEYMGEFGIAGRRYLRKGGDERTHQVHIFAFTDRENIERHLAVRDYLRCHREEAECYGELKAKLAEEYPFDIEGYCDGKDEFVKGLEQRALAWRREFSSRTTERI